MQLDLERVQSNVREADTEDLLDRATVYRAEMEPAALEIIDAELRRRGISGAPLEAHKQKRSREVLLDEAGRAVTCGSCHRPAIGRGWAWHRMWGWLPVFPRRMDWCSIHQPNR